MNQVGEQQQINGTLRDTQIDGFVMQVCSKTYRFGPSRSHALFWLHHEQKQKQLTIGNTPKSFCYKTQGAEGICFVFLFCFVLILYASGTLFMAFFVIIQGWMFFIVWRRGMGEDLEFKSLLVGLKSMSLAWNEHLWHDPGPVHTQIHQ